MDYSSSVTRVYQVQLLLPVVILLFSVTSATVEVADQAARWNPEQGCDGHDGHCEGFFA